MLCRVLFTENWTSGPKATLPSVTDRHLNIPAIFMGFKRNVLWGVKSLKHLALKDGQYFDSWVVMKQFNQSIGEKFIKYSYLSFMNCKHLLVFAPQKWGCAFFFFSVQCILNISGYFLTGQKKRQLTLPKSCPFLLCAQQNLGQLSSSSVFRYAIC